MAFSTWDVNQLPAPPFHTPSCCRVINDYEQAERERPRSLTLPLPPAYSDDILEAKQRSFKQSQSKLFAELPQELRNLIYEYTIGGETLHIVQKRQGMGYVRCNRKTGADEKCWPHVCWKPGGRQWLYEKTNLSRPADVSLLPLILTCRRVYFEATFLFYTHNTFITNSLPQLLSLKAAMLSSHFNIIRALTLHWNLPPNFYPQCISLQALPCLTHDPFEKNFTVEAWERLFCFVKKSMEGLRDLKVEIGYTSFVVSPGWERRLFEPAKGVMGLHVFEVRVPWKFQGVDWCRDEDAEFVVYYRDSGRGYKARGL